jgi:hypothetical protein
MSHGLCRLYQKLFLLFEWKSITALAALPLRLVNKSCTFKLAHATGYFATIANLMTEIS